MNTTKTFNRYNFVTGAVDGTLAYDFSTPAVYPQEEVYESPRRRKPQARPQTQTQDWIKEDQEQREQTYADRRQGTGLGVVPFLGAVAVVALVVMLLLAQIQLVNLSDTAVSLEAQIEELKTQRDKLTVEYETVFNLKDVEEYATGVLGMQEPRDDQIYYLTNVNAGDKAVVITDETTDMFSLGLEDVVASFKANVQGLFE
jgi:cell division protein FtsL